MQNTKSRIKLTASALACALSFQGCGLDTVDVPGSLVGPSELGVSIQMFAYPDIVVADGIQTAGIQAKVRDQNGKDVVGKPIVFTIADEQGRTAEIGTLTSANGQRVFGSTTINTNSQGIAQVVYTTPERRDFTADSRIIIGARPVGTDANGAPITTLRIELRSAEPRRFPQGGATAPTCSFIRAPNNPVVTEGTTLRFTSTSSAASDGYVVRYEWYFGDGTTSEGAEGTIDTQHGFKIAGVYTVTHIVTSNTGGQSSCSATITVIP